MIDGLVRFIEGISEAYPPGEVREFIQDAVANARSTTREMVAKRLVKNLEDVTEEHPEYDYPPLRQHLIDVFSNYDIITVHPHSLRVRIMQNVPSVAGTYEDLLAGWPHRAETLLFDIPGIYVQKSSLRSRAYRVWKYGIYRPAREGGGGFVFGYRTGKGFSLGPKEMPGRYPRKVVADYDAVIAERLALWGDKAPYWWFLEFGNRNFKNAYPKFDGTSFISTTEMEAEEFGAIAIQEQVDAARAHFINRIEEDIREGIEGRPPTQVFSERVDIRGGWKRFLVETSTGKRYYKYQYPSGKFAAAEIGERTFFEAGYSIYVP